MSYYIHLVERKSYVYAIAAIITWSTVASAFKISLRYVNFLQLLFFSSLFFFLILLSILALQQKLTLLKCSKKEYVYSAILGFLNPFIYYCILFKAYSILPAQEAQALNYTWPRMISLLSIPLLKQKIGMKSILAILISFIGVLIISTRGNITSLSFSNAGGVALALGSAAVWALFWIYNIKDKRDEVVKLFLNFSFGIIFIVFFLFIK